MNVLVKVPIMDFVTGNSYEKNLLNFLEDPNAEVALEHIRVNEDTDEFLEALKDIFESTEGEHIDRLFEGSSFETLIKVFGIQLILELFKSHMTATQTCDGDCSKCISDEDVPVDAPKEGCAAPSESVESSSIVNEFTWHSEAVFDVLGNNEDTIKGRLLSENIVEVYCTVKNPILKKNVLHRVHMGQRVSADALVFDVNDGIMRISICEPEREVVLF